MLLSLSRKELNETLTLTSLILSHSAATLIALLINSSAFSLSFVLNVVGVVFMASQRPAFNDLVVFMGQLLAGKVYCQLTMEGDNLRVDFYETKDGVVRERRYEQLSGGQRRCVELAFSPFALSEMVFARCGVRVPLLVIDELTTHMGAEEKPIVCEILRMLDRDTILVIDHDTAVQGEFDVVYEVTNNGKGVVIERAA